MNDDEKKQVIGSILYKYRKGITKKNIEAVTDELIEAIK